MNWTQVIELFNNMFLSALVTGLLVFVIFGALIIKKNKGYQSSLFATPVALLIANLVCGIATILALFFPIAWMVITAVFLFKVTVKSGQVEIIKHFMASIISDRRLQALMIAFSFGSFLSSIAGFGTPVAITAVM